MLSEEILLVLTLLSPLPGFLSLSSDRILASSIVLG